MRKDYIVYFHRCFTYAIMQNKGDTNAMSDAIRCIPLHAFNDHSKCGNWCGFLQNRETYDHRIVPGGLHDPKLLEVLNELFSKLADNAVKFSAGASSNANESLNASMSAKCPKRVCHSKCASADYRFACVVGQKNLGESYTEKILENLNLKPGNRLKQYNIRSQKLLTDRRLKIKKPEFKKKRLFKKKQRAALRYRIENVEGVTYETNCALLSEPGIVTETRNEDNDSNTQVLGISIVLLDLETTGFSSEAEILQIAAKSGKEIFNIYVNPVGSISAKASEVHGLTSSYGNLLYYGVIVPSIPMRAALAEFQNWLIKLGSQCCVAVHNLNFDGPRLMRVIENYSMTEDFKSTILGFVDTLEIIRSKNKGKSSSIAPLASANEISINGAHNAIEDCKILENILHKMNIGNDHILENMKLFEERRTYWSALQSTRNILSGLTPLATIVSISIRKKLASAGVTLESLTNAYQTSGEDGLKKMIVSNDSLKSLQKMSIEYILSYFTKKIISIPKNKSKKIYVLNTEKFTY